MLLAALQDRGDEVRITDAALMEQLANRRESALGDLYDRYGRIVYSLAYRVTRQEASAQEVVQEVFLQLWRNAHQYHSSRGSLEAWLLTLARNRALDHVRAKSERQRRREDSLTELSLETSAPSPEPGPEHVLDQRTRAQRVRALVAALPEVQRRAIELAYFEGMTHSEISEALKQPLGTVKTWIRSALLRLRREVAGAN